MLHAIWIGLHVKHMLQQAGPCKLTSCSATDTVWLRKTRPARTAPIYHLLLILDTGCDVAQGNALGGEGLTRLCPGLAACSTLLELNLRAVGISEEQQEAVRQLADVASCHAALQIINLDGNLIGALVCMCVQYVQLCTIPITTCGIG